MGYGEICDVVICGNIKLLMVMFDGKLYVIFNVNLNLYCMWILDDVDGDIDFWFFRFLV